MIKRLFARAPLMSLIREGAPLLGLYWLYSTIRWFVARDSPYEAFGNAFRIIDLERQLGLFAEQALQRWLIHHAMSVVQFANTFYTVGYFPVLILFAALLYRCDRGRFLAFKLTFLLTLGFALVCFSLFPVAPPRMLPGVGFVDTQQVYGSGMYRDKFVLSFYNPYAAMPSLHFACALLVGMLSFSFDRRALKALGAIYPSCMAVVVVATGHHYILDIAGGAVVVLLAQGLVKTLPSAVGVPAHRVAGLTAGFTLTTGAARAKRADRAVWRVGDRSGQIQRRRHQVMGELFTVFRRPPL